MAQNETRSGASLERSDLMTWLDTPGPCVSIYLPTHSAGPQTRQDPIRLKNLVTVADTRLERAGVPTEDRAQLLGPARERIDDRDFWNHQASGLAYLLAGGFDRELKLQVGVEELAIVGDRFHLKPLIPLIDRGGSFYLLAVSRAQVKLYECTADRLTRIDVSASVPESLPAALGRQVGEGSLQFHSQRRGAGARREAIFHGQGAGTDDRDAETRRFLELVDAGLDDALVETGLPMLVAGVEELVAEFRRTSSYPNLLDEALTGNFDDTPIDELHERAWETLAPLVDEQRRRLAARIDDELGTGRASTSLDEVVRAAHEGRVDTLFVAAATQIWGEYDSEKHRARRTEDEGGADLLDLAAIRTLGSGGVVYAVDPEEVPGGEHAAALFRY